MRLASILDRIRENIRRHGLADTLFDVALRAINRIVFVTVLKGVHIGAPNPAYLDVNHKYRCAFLDRDVLLGFSRHPEYEMSEGFVRHALEKGDESFGILDGGTLASYGWYSNHTTDISDDLRLHFDRRYMYMYKGFTHPDYRGQRLHGVGMTMALKEYLDRGFKGLVSFVEWNNFDSLKSVYKMGYRDFGQIYVVRILGRYLIYRTRGCEDYGFGLETPGT